MNAEGGPEPSADPRSPAEPSPTQELDPVVEAFDSVCQRLSGFDDSLSTEDIDGYFTAVAASWRAIPLQEVMPRLCGDAFERAFADPVDEAAARSALQARLDQLRAALDPEALLVDPDRLRLAPLMQVWDDAARQELVQAGICTADEAAVLVTGMSWADGFFHALEDFAQDWPDPNARDEESGVYEELLETVASLVMNPTSDEFRAFVARGWKGDDPTRDELVDEACFAVQDLRIWWIDRPPKRTPLRAASTPGRNDPCFCGSGRKYKKCHGA